jgi:hypothetical protein
VEDGAKGFACSKARTPKPFRGNGRLKNLKIPTEGTENTEETPVFFIFRHNFCSGGDSLTCGEHFRFSFLQCCLFLVFRFQHGPV